VLQRVGHTEAAVDLARLAGLYPAGVICEVMNTDGTMAKRQNLEQFAATHGITFVTVAQLVSYRLRTERLVHRVAEARLPGGAFQYNGADVAVGETRHAGVFLAEADAAG